MGTTRRKSVGELKHLHGHIEIIDRYLHGVDKRTPRVMNSWQYVRRAIRILSKEVNHESRNHD